MKEEGVGIRDLKSHLSGYIKMVKDGRSVVITEHGRPVGRIVPVDESEKDRIQSLTSSGFASWSGQKLRVGHATVKLRQGKKSLSQIVVENRD